MKQEKERKEKEAKEKKDKEEKEKKKKEEEAKKKKEEEEKKKREEEAARPPYVPIRYDPDYRPYPYASSSWQLVSPDYNWS